MPPSNTSTTITSDEMEDAILVQFKAEAIRKYLEWEGDTNIALEDGVDFSDVLDEAQGSVYTGTHTRRFIIIEVIK